MAKHLLCADAGTKVPELINGKVPISQLPDGLGGGAGAVDGGRADEDYSQTEPIDGGGA